MMRVYQGTSSAATNYSTEPTITPTCGVNYPITVRLRQDINSDQSRLIIDNWNIWDWSDNDAFFYCNSNKQLSKDLAEARKDHYHNLH